MFIGASEQVARVRLLGVEELLPGHETWLQLELEALTTAARGDRYILRRPSPGETLGGGVVVDPHPKGRHKRFSDATLASLDALTKGTPTDILSESLATLKAAPLGEVILRSGLDESIAIAAAEDLRSSGSLVNLDAGQLLARTALVASQPYWQDLEYKAIQEIEAFHRTFPLRKGLAKEELKSKLKLSPRIFTALLRSLSLQNLVEENGPMIMRLGHVIRFNTAQQRSVDDLLSRFASSPYAPPTAKDCIAEVKEDIYNALIDMGELVPVPPDVVFRRLDYQKMVSDIRQLIQQNGSISAAQVRDHFNTSRRYALALLEHLDTIGVTIREGDSRRLKS
jgi:selenocysteine-specific elongation factor